MLIILLLTISAYVHAYNNIHIEENCNKKIDLNYMEILKMKKRIIVINTIDEIEDCDEEYLYKFIFQNNPSVNLKEIYLVSKNNTSDYENYVLNQIQCYHGYRISDIGIIYLIDCLNTEIIASSIFRTIMRRFGYAFTLILFKNSSHCLIENMTMHNFLNVLLLEFKMLNVFVILLENKLNSTIYTYDIDDCNYERYGCRVKTLKQFNKSFIQFNNKKLSVNYPVKITLFSRKNSNEKIMNDNNFELFNLLMNRINGYVGEDAFLIGDVVSHFKFKTYIIEHTDFEPFGYLAENGSVLGTLGEITEGAADIALNSRFITSYNVDDSYYFLGFHAEDSLCALVPKADVVPLWLNVVNIYEFRIWLLLFSQLVFITLLRWIYNRYVKRSTKSIILITFETFSTIMVPVYRLWAFPQRILLISCLLINLILMSILQVPIIIISSYIMNILGLFH